MNNLIPFNEAKWKEGWTPVTKDGRDLKDFIKLGNGYVGLIPTASVYPYAWDRNGQLRHTNHDEYTLMFKPPVVEKVLLQINYNTREDWVLEEHFRANPYTTILSKWKITYEGEKAVKAEIIT